MRALVYIEGSQRKQKKEQRVIELLTQINDLAADAGDVFFDIAGEDLARWGDIRGFISSIKLTLDMMVETHEEERGYR